MNLCAHTDKIQEDSAEDKSQEGMEWAVHGHTDPLGELGILLLEVFVYKLLAIIDQPLSCANTKKMQA